MEITTFFSDVVRTYFCFIPDVVRACTRLLLSHSTLYELLRACTALYKLPPFFLSTFVRTFSHLLLSHLLYQYFHRDLPHFPSFLSRVCLSFCLPHHLY